RRIVCDIERRGDVEYGLPTNLWAGEDANEAARRHNVHALYRHWILIGRRRFDVERFSKNEFVIDESHVNAEQISISVDIEQCEQTIILASSTVSGGVLLRVVRTARHVRSFVLVCQDPVLPHFRQLSLLNGQ